MQYIQDMTMHDRDDKPTIVQSGDKLMLCKKTRFLSVHRNGFIIQLNLKTGEYQQYLGFLRSRNDYFKGFCIIIAHLMGFCPYFEENDTHMLCTLLQAA